MSALLSSTDPSLQTYSGNYQNSFFNRSDNPLSFPLAQPQNLYHKNLFPNGFQTFNDDADLIMFEQPRKLRNQDHTMNMLAGNNVTQGQLPRNPVFRKTPEIQSAKGSNIFSQGERAYNQNNSKETSESLSTNNSNSNFSEHALKREIIELDDDDNAIEPNEQTHSQIFSEPLALADDAISGLNRPQDQLLLLRNLMAQNNFPLQRPISDPSVNLLASQLLLANQFNQLSSRNYLNLMGNPSLYNANPSLTSSLLYNMQLNNLARQSQSQFLSTGFPEPSSITGKRFEPQGGFENLVRQDEILRPATAQSRARQEVILVDDDEFTWQGATSSQGQKKKIFLIEKTARRVTKPLIKTEKKKQVFTVIKCKPGQKFRPVRGYISRKTALLRANLRVKEEDSSEESRTPEETEGLRRSTRRRAERVFDSSAYIRALREARDAKPVIEDYVINLHITEGEENKDISETPIGEAFQVELVPFCIDMEAERPVKCVWDPEEIDQEMLENCINQIESKFERKIVGQEFIIKTLKKYEMDLEKVIEEIETNKMTFRSFFEVKQKVSRNRIFHM